MMTPAVLDRMVVVKGDITKLEVNVIVSAANNTLLGGAGVGGAIHKAAGQRLHNACVALGGCPTGGAKMTPGFGLLADNVIHAVGPVYDTGVDCEADLLRSCYRAALRLAAEAKAETIAFPCISTGAFKYPTAEACAVAVETVAEWLSVHDLPRVVTFCCYLEADARRYRTRLKA